MEQPILRQLVVKRARVAKNGVDNCVSIISTKNQLSKKNIFFVWVNNFKIIPGKIFLGKNIFLLLYYCPCFDLLLFV